jgi:hypothetical protein
MKYLWKKFAILEFMTIFVLLMMMALAGAGVDKVSDNKRLKRKITRFSVWERCVQSCNTKFFEINEWIKLPTQTKGWGDGQTMSVPFSSSVIRRGTIKACFTWNNAVTFIGWLIGRQYIAVDDIKKLWCFTMVSRMFHVEQFYIKTDMAIN